MVTISPWTNSCLEPSTGSGMRKNSSAVIGFCATVDIGRPRRTGETLRIVQHFATRRHDEGKSDAFVVPSCRGDQTMVGASWSRDGAEYEHTEDEQHDHDNQE